MYIKYVSVTFEKLILENLKLILEWELDWSRK